MSVPPQYPRDLLFVPRSIRPAVLHWGHSSKLVVHPGVRGTLAAISQCDVHRFVASCAICTQTKSSSSPPTGLLRPLHIPSCPWSHIAMDFVKRLPSSANNTVILTIVDRFSKAAHFVPLCKLPFAKETAQIVIEHVFHLHVLPSDIVSDKGPQFASQFWRKFCHQVGA